MSSAELLLCAGTSSAHTDEWDTKSPGNVRQKRTWARQQFEGVWGVLGAQRRDRLQDRKGLWRRWCLERVFLDGGEIFPWGRMKPLEKECMSQAQGRGRRVWAGWVHPVSYWHHRVLHLSLSCTLVCSPVSLTIPWEQDPSLSHQLIPSSSIK